MKTLKHILTESLQDKNRLIKILKGDDATNISRELKKLIAGKSPEDFSIDSETFKDLVKATTATGPLESGWIKAVQKKILGYDPAQTTVDPVTGRMGPKPAYLGSKKKRDFPPLGQKAREPYGHEYELSIIPYFTFQGKTAPDIREIAILKKGKIIAPMKDPALRRSIPQWRAHPPTKPFGMSHRALWKKLFGYDTVAIVDLDELNEVREALEDRFGVGMRP